LLSTEIANTRHTSRQVMSKYTVSKKRAYFCKCSFDDHELMLIFFCKQHQHLLKMIRVFNFLCPITFTYLIYF